MAELRRSAQLTLAFGLASVLAIVLCHLALTDIWHGEGSLVLEWRILRIGFAVILAFHAAALATAYRAFKVSDPSG